jgi:hypothetical protein
VSFEAARWAFDDVFAFLPFSGVILKVSRARPFSEKSDEA